MVLLLTGIAVAYLGAALALAVYSTAQLHLLVRSFWGVRTRPPPLEGEQVPTVLVQLPVRNERRVMRALVRSIAALDWPRDRLHIQILDDSDDETVAICQEETTRLSGLGYRITHVRRGERTGYKAGALAHGLKQHDAAYIAIFDADFRPEPDFLRVAMAPLLARPELGLVQARWGHLNRDASVFTRAQAFHLDAHFGVEQLARSQEPLLMGFNGTAGIWRRAAIDEAGGWSADSLTEDLDLSFRAQLAGWTLTYLDGLEAPAELPEEVRAIRTQQHRWMKGGAQVSRKLLGALWTSSVPSLTKLQGTVHLMSGCVFLAVVALLVLTPLLYPAQVLSPAFARGIQPAALALQYTLVVVMLFYATSCVRRGGARGLLRFVRDFVPFLALSSGLALHNALAVIEGWSGQQTPFVRTPKRGDPSGDGVVYSPLPTGWIAWSEMALCAWATGGLVLALLGGQWVLAGFLATQAVGCGVVALGGWSPRRSPVPGWGRS